MRVLLDTHVVLWFQLKDKRLDPRWLHLIESNEDDCFVSIASHWEVSIKHSLGKLRLPEGLLDLFENIKRSGLQPLQVEQEHILALASLPHHHRDPFDRMLIAQAKHEGMHVLSADPHFKLYDVPLVDL